MILRFGEQVDARPLVATTSPGLGVATSQEISGRKVAAYLAKYVTKSVGDIGVSARRLHPGVIDELTASDHVRHILRTIADLAEEPGYRAVGAWLHTLGYRGHVTTKTRRQQNH